MRWNTNVSHGSGATRLRCGGTFNDRGSNSFNDCSIANLLLSVQKSAQLVKISTRRVLYSFTHASSSTSHESRTHYYYYYYLTRLYNAKFTTQNRSYDYTQFTKSLAQTNRGAFRGGGLRLAPSTL